MTGSNYTVGRDESCNLIVTKVSSYPQQGSTLNSMHISRLHFELTIVDGKPSIINRSNNGTYLNHGELTKDIPYLISNNDTIALLQESNPMFRFILLWSENLTYLCLIAKYKLLLRRKCQRQSIHTIFYFTIVFLHDQSPGFIPIESKKCLDLCFIAKYRLCFVFDNLSLLRYLYSVL